MPSLLHEGLLEMIRDQPEFAADLLRDILHVDVPSFSQARLAEAELTQVVPVEFRADAVILFANERPVFGCVVEAQLSEDPRKLFTWPVYAVTARARYECPFVVLVVAPEESVARWACRGVELGAGLTWHALVVGPQGIPLIVSDDEARKDPEMAVLSALAHARIDTGSALEVTMAALAGVVTVPPERQVLYFHLLRAAVGDAARKAFDMLPQRLEKYLTEDEQRRMREARAEGLTQGLTQGLAAALIRVVEGRGLAVPLAIRERIETASADELDAMLARAAHVASVDELFAS